MKGLQSDWGVFMARLYYGTSISAPTAPSTRDVVEAQQERCCTGSAGARCLPCCPPLGPAPASPFQALANTAHIRSLRCRAAH